MSVKVTKLLIIGKKTDSTVVATVFFLMFLNKFVVNLKRGSLDMTLTYPLDEILARDTKSQIVRTRSLQVQKVLILIF